MTAAENQAWVRQRVAARGWTREIEELAELGWQLVLAGQLLAWTPAPQHVCRTGCEHDPGDGHDPVSGIARNH